MPGHPSVKALGRDQRSFPDLEGFDPSFLDEAVDGGSSEAGGFASLLDRVAGSGGRILHKDSMVTWIPSALGIPTKTRERNTTDDGPTRRIGGRVDDIRPRLFRALDIGH